MQTEQRGASIASTTANSLLSILAALNEPTPKMRLARALGKRAIDIEPIIANLIESKRLSQDEFGSVWIESQAEYPDSIDRSQLQAAVSRLRSEVNRYGEWPQIFLLEKAAGRVDEAVKIFRRELSKTYLLDHAVDECWKLVENVSLTDALENTRSYLLNLQGVLLRDMGRLQPACKKFREALKHSASRPMMNMVVRQNLADILFETGEARQALCEIDKATAQASIVTSRAQAFAKSAAQRDRAVMLARLGQTEDARVILFGCDVYAEDGDHFQRSVGADLVMVEYIEARLAISRCQFEVAGKLCDHAIGMLASLPGTDRTREIMHREMLTGMVQCIGAEAGRARHDVDRILVSAAATAGALGLRVVQAETLLHLARFRNDEKLVERILRSLDSGCVRLTQECVSTIALILRKQGFGQALIGQKVRLLNSPFAVVQTEISNALDPGSI